VIKRIAFVAATTTATLSLAMTAFASEHPSKHRHAAVGAAGGPDQVIHRTQESQKVPAMPGGQPAQVHPTGTRAITHARVHDAVNGIVGHAPKAPSASCRPHYRKHTELVRRHGRRVAEIVCVRVAPAKRPGPSAGSTGTTGPTSATSAPTAGAPTTATVAFRASMPGGPGTMDLTIEPTVAAADGFKAGASTVELVDETTNTVLATYFNNDGSTDPSEQAASPITSLELSCNLGVLGGFSDIDFGGPTDSAELCTPIHQNALVTWPVTDKVVAVATFTGVPESASSAGYAPSTSPGVWLPVVATIAD
jgi:hypothetical protein